MGENGRPGDRQRSHAHAREIEGIQRDAISESLEPAVQIVPGDGPGDQVCDENGNRELPEQQDDHVAVAGAEHLADTNLLGAAASGKGGQAEKAQTGDEDGDGYEDRENLALPLVALVEPLITVAQQRVRNGNTVNEGALCARDIAQRLLQSSGCNT